MPELSLLVQQDGLQSMWRRRRIAPHNTAVRNDGVIEFRVFGPRVDGVTAPIAVEPFLRGEMDRKTNAGRTDHLFGTRSEDNAFAKHVEE